MEDFFIPLIRHPVSVNHLFLSYKEGDYPSIPIINDIKPKSL